LTNQKFPLTGNDLGCIYAPLEMHSLIPRPFPPPVFDRLQYANTEGEGLGDFITCGYVR